MKKTIAILSFIFVAGTLTNAQDSIIKHSPNGVFDKVFDRYGKGYKLEELRVNTVVLDPETNTPKLLQLCSPGYFNLFFEIGSGMEGNSPTEIARRNVLCQVFSDISQFIVPVNPSTKVNILVGNINKDLPGYGVNGNMTPASSSPVLGLATGFYVVPNYSPSVKGIIDNEIWKTINSGTDSYTNVASPLYSTDPSGAQFFHGKVCINFDNSTMDWHTDLTQTTFPNYYDLYSVVLHELTHALGFASLINANGDSKLGTAYTYYTRYDQFLKSPTNLPLITNSGGCSMYQFGFNPSLSTNILAPSSSSCASAVVYDGSVTQLTYTPNVFADESSLSHFEDSCHAPVPQPDDEYYVMSNGGGTGPTYMKRYLKPEERNVLCDIGYKVNTTYGNAINLNNYNYGGSICPGNGVVGINDGLTGAMYTYMVNTTNSIPITNILANDYNAISFECLEPVYGLGTVSNSAGTSTVFTAGVAPGVELLRYVPVSTSGARGNITYVLIYVMSANCTPTACSLLNNNGFESSTTCGQLDYSPPLVATDCWLPFTNTPDIFQRNCTNSIFNWNNQFSIPALYFNNPGSDSWSGVPNNNFIGINSMVSSNGDRTTESFQSLLNVPLVSGQTYQLSFRAKVAYNSPMYYPPLGKNGEITFGASPSTLAALNSTFNALPAIVTPLGVPITITNHADYVMNSSNTWDLYSQTFTYSGASNYMNFIFFNTSNLNTPIPSTNEYLYIYVDDIELIALDPVNFLTIPNTLCINSLLTDLAVYAPVPNGVFSGPGVQNNSGTFSFDATLAGIGNHVIAYTFTNNNNCSVTIFDTVTVNPLPTVTVAPANSTICAGQQVVLTASGANTYTWSPATGLSATTGTTVIASPASTTTYTITGTNTTTGCSNTQTITVTVNPLPVVTVAPANSTICAGQQVVLTASGANTYTWSPSTGLSATTGASVTATPGSTITYTVTGSSLGCTATQTANITVNPAPVVTVAPANSTICAGQQVTLTASGADTYLWSPATGLSATTGTTVIASPVSTTTYTITGTNTTTGCSNTQTITVTVNPLPVISVSPASSTICAGQQVVLTASGANTYTWSPSTGLSATTGASVTATPNSTITYSVTGSSSGCSATQTASITVNPCTDCGTGTLIAGNVGSSPAANTTLRIPNNITITGNVNFIGNNVKIHPGVTITVASTATLNITGAHFYGCENMWNGIQVQPGGKVNIQPYIVGGTVQKTTLIEDAEIAIDFLPITAQQASAFLQVNNATFNRNTTSIRVQSYAFANVGSMIVVKNSLFTCRNIYNTANSNWPLTTVVKAANGSTNPYANPYIPSTYSVLTSMKVPRTNTFSNIGIHLQNVGTTVATNPTTYNNVIIGSTVTGEYNVFDNLKTAIYCYNTNLNLVNVTMQFPQTITFAMNSQQTAPNIGTGVFAESDILHKCAVSIASATYINKFYNLNCALYTDNYYNVTFYKNAVRSLRTSSYNLYSYYNGKTGVYMNAKEFENVNISNNSIYNIDKAIWFNFNHVVPSTTVTFNVNDNNILRNLGTSATGAFGADAIYVANALSASSYNGTINVKNNIIDGYTRGLTFLNWHKTTINAQDNNITLGIDPNSFYGTPSYGIAVNNCVSTGAPKNKITGNTVLGFSQQVDSYKGISFVQSWGNDLHCNSVKNTHTGLYFSGQGGVSTYKNSMENHRYGFVLDNNGIIGQQGSPTTPADNRWLGTNWSTTGTPNGNFKNACLNGSSTTNSLMYTRSATNYTPNGSVFELSPVDKAYTTVAPATLFHISASMFSPCPISAVPFPIPFSSASNSETVVSQEALDLASSGTEEQKIVAQNQVYRIEDPATSENTLGSLSVLQNNSNIGTLWNVEKALLAGDLIVAAQENASVQAQNTLEEAYQDYYRLVLKHRSHTFNSTDSLRLITLAEGCPSVVGAVVYQAAVLYNIIYKTAEVFESNCATPQGRATQQESSFSEAILSNQSGHSLFPIPNDGTFTIQGTISEGDELMIHSMNGEILYRTVQQVTTEQLYIESNLRAGLYFVTIHSPLGIEYFKCKIVIIK